MATSITLNGYNLQSSTVKTKTIAHDDGPPLELNTLEVAREDGAKLISSSYGVKKIEIEGIIKGTSQSDLEANIDAFKKNVIGTNLDLDISYAGSTRRYKVATNVVITRDFYHLTFAPFSITCEVLDPPFGLDTGITEALSVDNLTLATETLSCYLDGTAKPKPKIRFILDTAGNLDEIRIKNTTTGGEVSQMSISTAWVSGDMVEIDTENRTVKKGMLDIGFEGVFPEFDLGLNQMEVYTSPPPSDLQQQTSYDTEWALYDTPSYSVKAAQSFQKGVTGPVDSLQVLIYRTGDPDPTRHWLYVRIETDSSGSPSGTLVDANATKTLYDSDIGTSPNWIVVNFPGSFTLTTGVTYWIVLQGEFGLYPYPEENICWKASSSNLYANGLAKTWTGGPWGQSSGIVDFCFKIDNTFSVNWKYKTIIRYTKRYL